jgi:hypothetical protein
VTLVAFKLSEFLINSFKCHIKVVNRTLKYMRHTKKLAIKFNTKSEAHIRFLASNDASFVDDIKTRFSFQEYAFKLFNELIDWKTFKQRTVITSFTETELLIISVVKKKLIYWQRLFKIIYFQINQKSTIQCDNQQTIRALIISKLITKLRHVDIHKHWLRQEIALDKIDIEWVKVTKILVDELIKTFSSQRHKKFIRLFELITLENEKTDNN